MENPAQGVVAPTGPPAPTTPTPPVPEAPLPAAATPPQAPPDFPPQAAASYAASTAPDFPPPEPATPPQAVAGVAPAEPPPSAPPKVVAGLGSQAPPPKVVASRRPSEGQTVQSFSANAQKVPVSDTVKKEYLTAVKTYEQQVGPNTIRGKMIVECLPITPGATAAEKRLSPLPGTGYAPEMYMGPVDWTGKDFIHIDPAVGPVRAHGKRPRSSDGRGGGGGGGGGGRRRTCSEVGRISAK
ncbi:hypothetical protein HPB48_004735 [Haemaphysalis longicornis]|uniref:Uncharacterized protein n=1 Tax=Haemaphysalis longicornis TaxID=44386 RepID=A0A9J6G312_HAELO|nr:hypothetical protein HPB48_004735 [Haemaphysalis longicornis]